MMQYLLKIIYLNTHRRNKGLLALILFTFFFYASATAQSVKETDRTSESNPYWKINLTLNPGLFNFLGTYKDIWEPGLGISAKLDYNPKIFNNFSFNLNGGYIFGNYSIAKDLNYYIFPLGVGGTYHLEILKDSLVLKPNLSAGYYFLFIPSSVKGDSNDLFINPYLKLEVSLEYQIFSQFWAGIGASYYNLFDSKETIKMTNYFASLSFSFDKPLSKKGLVIQSVSLKEIQPIERKIYAENLGSIKVYNPNSDPIENVEIFLELENYSEKTKIRQSIPYIPSKKSIDLISSIIIQPEKMIQLAGGKTQIKMETIYFIGGEKQIIKDLLPVNLYKLSTINWGKPEQLGAFTQYNHEQIIEFSLAAKKSAQKQMGISEQISDILAVFLAMKNFYYVEKSVFPYAENRFDQIQFPIQTLKRRAGNCVDLSIFLAAALTSIGEKVAFVLTSNHVFLLIAVDRAYPKTVNIDSKNWIPFDSTLLGKNFIRAWEEGYKQYNSNILKTIINVEDCIKKYEPVNFNLSVGKNPSQITNSLISEETRLILEFIKADYLNMGARELNSLGVGFVRDGNEKEAIKLFLLASQKDPSYENPLRNLFKIYKKIKDKEAAAEVLKKLKILNPNEEYEKELQKMEK